MDCVDQSKVPSQSAILCYLRQAKLKLCELEGIIKNDLTKHSSKGRNNLKVLRVQWLRKRSKIQLLQTHLRSINGNLTTCFAATILSGQVRLQTSVDELAVKMAINKHCANSHIHTKLSGPAEHPSRLSDRVFYLQSDVSEGQSALTPAKDGITIGESSHRTCFKEQACVVGEATDVEDDLENLNWWNESCACCYRSTYRLQANDVLSHLLGSFCLSYTGSNKKRPCYQISCRKRMLTVFNINYYLPWWVLAKAVNIFLSFDPMGSPYMSLQLSRVRPDTSKIFHLTTAGDIGGMKTVFARGIASPNDVSDTFGYSVLHVSVIASKDLGI